MNIAVLGSTGSIGRQALEVIRALDYSVSALAAGSQVGLLADQIEVFRPPLVSVQNAATAERLRSMLAGRIDPAHMPELVYGAEGAAAAATASGTERVLAAISGFAGMPPVLAALRAGIDVALANKEALVAAGTLVKQTAAASGARLIPVDSEHAAVFQCLQGKRLSDKDVIYLTCSGGPFFGKTRAELAHVSVADALAHPTWRMGKKITIDSATLMNKALELIEACFLFDADPAQIKVVVHRESVIHSMVGFADRSVLAQLGFPDMRLAIHQGLTFPQIRDNTLTRPFDPTAAGVSDLSFRPVDRTVFPALDLAREAMRQGGAMPLVLNAANEAAVALFLDGRLPFLAIYDRIAEAMERYRHASVEMPTQADDMMNLHQAVMAEVRRL